MADTIYHGGDIPIYRHTSLANNSKCMAEIWSSDGSVYQCRNQAKYYRDMEGRIIPLGFCGTHDPKRVRERRKSQDAYQMAKKKRKQIEKEEAAKLDAMKDNALKAITQISHGHPDPIGLANAILRGEE